MAPAPYVYGDMQCRGGGYEYLSNTVSRTYLYKNFNEKFPKCTQLNESGSDGVNFSKIKAAIDTFVEQVILTNKCPELTSLLKEFQKTRDRAYNHLKIITPLRTQNIFKNLSHLDSNMEKVYNVDEGDDIKGVQIRSTPLANTAVLCGSSDISVKVFPYWSLLSALDSIKSLGGKSHTVTKNGTTAESCFDVTAEGDDDLKEFFVNLRGADKSKGIELEYETYHAKDQIIVSAGGKVLHDSGCLSTNAPVRIPISLNSVQEDMIKVDVRARCDGSRGTYWQLRLSCTQPKINGYRCQNEVDTLKKGIKQILKISDNLNDHYWMKSKCYMAHYQQLMGEVKIPDTLLLPYAFEHCVSENCKKKLKHKKIESDNEVIIKNKVKTPILREPNSIKQKSKSNYEEGRNHFIQNKNWYCLMQKTKLDLFTKVSRRYCLSAYPTLLKDE